MAVTIRSHKYRDPIGQARRKRAWLRRGLIAFVFLAMLGGAAWKVPHVFRALAQKIHSIGPHTTTPERQAIGTWCRSEDCEFFDGAGRWGSALRSSGPLLLLVDDQRSSDSYDPKLVTGLLAVVSGLPPLGMTARQITMPDAEPGGIAILTTKGYSLYFDALGDVADQLGVLGVFLADRAKDPAFAPQYIDLRTPGRVYYK